MDPSTIATALTGAQSGLTQLAVATQMERMRLDNSASVVKLIDAAQQNANSLANVGAGIGGNMDISV
ncbi:MAG TPA: hypothetical protein VH206_02830 [Xanthobacteraceae bacterium]|nr:hypothetical protein [Xanthobacteraceae bacterium]